MENKKYRLTLIGQYNEKALQFEFTKTLDGSKEEGFQTIAVETEDGRSLILSTKDTIFIEELKNE